MISDFVFLHYMKITLRFLKLLKPLTFDEIILNIHKTRKLIVNIYNKCLIKMYANTTSKVRKRQFHMFGIKLFHSIPPEPAPGSCILNRYLNSLNLLQDYFMSRLVLHFIINNSCGNCQWNICNFHLFILPWVIQMLFFELLALIPNVFRNII